MTSTEPAPEGSRKRKRLEFKPDTPRPEVKCDRKITDYIRTNSTMVKKFFAKNIFVILLILGE